MYSSDYLCGTPNYAPTPNRIDEPITDRTKMGVWDYFGVPHKWAELLINVNINVQVALEKKSAQLNSGYAWSNFLNFFFQNSKILNTK